jgi:hypothetical protein
VAGIQNGQMQNLRKVNRKERRVLQILFEKWLKIYEEGKMFGFSFEPFSFVEFFAVLVPIFLVMSALVVLGGTIGFALMKFTKSKSKIK